MAELKTNRFLLFVLLMILPAHALDVILSSVHASFKQKYEIKSYIRNGEKFYGGTLNQWNYQAKFNTSKVIVYIIERSRFVEVIRNAVRETRFQIAHELSEWHCELLFLGIDNFDDDDYYLIGAFMVEKIRPHPQSQTYFIIEIIGENNFDRAYQCHVLDIEPYQENAQICDGNLLTRLRSIPRGALRSAEKSDKEIRLYGYHPNAGEMRWRVDVDENDIYFTDVDLTSPKYNFKLRHPAKKICLLILSGRTYTTVIRYGGRLSHNTEVARILDDMTNNDEVLIILGVFNFDWTEIDIVTQIILKHSDGWQDIEEWKDLGYNVFTCGYGMFDTAYLNMDMKDKRFILQQTNSYVSEMIKVLVEEEVKERALHMYYYCNDDRWTFTKIPINLGNGRYIPKEEFNDYTFPWTNGKIAFIVFDSTEVNGRIDFSMVSRAVEELKRSAIFVVVINAINFGLDDKYVIAEWIDWHRGTINSDEIAVLGGGVFDTLFQSHFTTYNTLLNTKKNALKTIRNAYVTKGNEKKVFAAKIDDPIFDVWTYPMNTVNGFYEPDLIPDKNMFDSTGRKRIFFIITSAYNFHQIRAMESEIPVTKLLRENMERFYPYAAWNVYLVGLDHFGERDYHLFAELVKRQTNYERPFSAFVYVFNYGLGHAATFQYKDIAPFVIENRARILDHVVAFFALVCRPPQPIITIDD